MHSCCDLGKVILQGARVWKGAGRRIQSLAWARRSRGSVGAKQTETAKVGGGGKKRKHRGKTQTKDRRAQEAGLPRDRKLQVSQKEARKHRMWAQGKAGPHPEGGSAGENEAGYQAAGCY